MAEQVKVEQEVNSQEDDVSIIPGCLPTPQPKELKSGAGGLKSHTSTWEVHSLTVPQMPVIFLPIMLKVTAEPSPTDGRGQAAINLLPQRSLGCELIYPLGPGQGHSEVATAQDCFAETTHSPHLLRVYPVQPPLCPEPLGSKLHIMALGNADVLAPLCEVSLFLLCYMRPSVVLLREHRQPYKQAGEARCAFL